MAAFRQSFAGYSDDGDFVEDDFLSRVKRVASAATIQNMLIMQNKKTRMGILSFKTRCDFKTNLCAVRPARFFKTRVFVENPGFERPNCT